MTKADKELLLHFVLRMSMYVHPKETDSVINFMQGYEIGTKNKCDFTKRVRRLLADTYGISYSNDGWPGQIRCLAKRQHVTWLIMFKRITLEIIAKAEGGSLNDQQRALLKRSITAGLLNRVEPTGGPGFEEWVDEWLALCDVKNSWFKQLWTQPEWAIIEAIDQLVQANGIFEAQAQRLPSAALLQLKAKYAEAIIV